MEHPPARNRETEDRNTPRGEALAALAAELDDPAGLEDVHAGDFEPDHDFGDGRTGPALRLRGQWRPLGAEAATALERYVPTVQLGRRGYLFATADVDGDGLP